MTKIRQDAWSNENDLLLAETVLRHIREGSTQLNAFEEVGDILNRTAAACGFRWNAVVRNQYKQAIDLAKRQRKERKRAQRNNWKPSFPITTSPTNETAIHQPLPTDNITLSDVIQYLQQLKENYDARNHSLEQIERIKDQNMTLSNENSSLKKQLTQVNERLQTVETDYQAFIQIMDRARKLTLLDEKDDKPSPMFKMDKNGNLEQYMQG